MFGCERRNRLRMLREIRSIRDRIAATDNEGVAAHQLWQYPRVTDLEQEYGGMRKARIQVRMSDGWEKVTYDYDRTEALKEMSEAVYERLSETMRKNASII